MSDKPKLVHWSHSPDDALPASDPINVRDTRNEVAMSAPTTPHRSDNRARLGEAAVVAGTPGLGRNGDGLDGVRADAADAIVNILHHLAEAFPDSDGGARPSDDVQVPPLRRYLAHLNAAAGLDHREEYALAALDSARVQFHAELRGLDD